MADTKVAARVLVVDDNVELARRAGVFLAEAGHDVRVACSGAEGLRTALAFQPDLVVLDIMMEGMDGWQVCKKLRACSDALIMFATAKTGEANVERGLNMGADGYITKDYSMAELEARIQAMMRRAQNGDQQCNQDLVHADGYLTIDMERNQVCVKDCPIQLSPKEYQVLSYLVQADGRAVGYEELLENIWGRDYRADKTYLAIYVSRLRQKIERDSHEPEYVITHHGYGYQFRWPLADCNCAG